MRGVKTIKTLAEFETEMIANSDKLIILDFYATWCAPCKRMNPVVLEAARKAPGEIQVLKINVDKFDQLCQKYKVNSMPHFVFKMKGRRTYTVTGADVIQFQKRVDYYIKQDS